MIGHTEKIWLLLIGLTFTGAWFAETGQSGWPLTLTVAFLIGFKGKVVIDHYMEMRHCNSRLRHTLYIFGSVVLVMVILTHGWGEAIRDLTQIT